jgi:hypothetical protein
MVFRPPIVIVKVRDVPAVGEITENSSKRAAVSCGVQTAVSAGCRVPRIKEKDRLAVGDRAAELLDSRELTISGVDTDQQLNGSIKPLIKNRLDRVCNRRL